MRWQKNGKRKNTLIEIAWLLGSWAISFGCLGWLIGFKQLWEKQLDIQMHNTYFVLPPWAAALPFFLLSATIITCVRAGLTRFRRRSTLVVLLGLAMLWLLLVAYVVWLVNSIRTFSRPGL